MIGLGFPAPTNDDAIKQSKYFAIPNCSNEYCNDGDVSEITPILNPLFLKYSNTSIVSGYDALSPLHHNSSNNSFALASTFSVTPSSISNYL